MTLYLYPRDFAMLRRLAARRNETLHAAALHALAAGTAAELRRVEARDTSHPSPPAPDTATARQRLPLWLPGDLAARLATLEASYAPLVPASEVRREALLRGLDGHL